jgi:hypothetical protein
MSPQDILSLISTLSPEQQEAVEEFVRFLKNEKKEAAPGMSFRAALDEFVSAHPELLRRLAK